MESMHIDEILYVWSLMQICVFILEVVCASDENVKFSVKMEVSALSSLILKACRPGPDQIHCIDQLGLSEWFN